MAFIKQSAESICEPEVYLPAKEKDKVFQSPFNAEYLRRLKNHDPEIGNHFYAHFKPRLQMKLRACRLGESDVQEIMQETLVRVLKSVENNSIRTPEAFGGFVIGVCDNIVNDFFNDRMSRERFRIDIDEIDPPDPTLRVDTHIFRRELQELVNRILTDLSPKDRNLLRAILFEELSRDEMCRRFGASSPDRLRVMLHRARVRFAKSCQKRGLDFSRYSKLL